MRTEINGYLQHLKSVCPELTDAELLTFGNGLKVSTFKKGSIYIAAGKMQKQGGFLVLEMDCLQNLRAFLKIMEC